MLERIDMHEKSSSLEKNSEALAAGGIPEEMREGILLANEHYGEIDLETYRLNIMNSLDIAEDKVPSMSKPAVPQSQKSLDVEETESYRRGKQR